MYLFNSFAILLTPSVLFVPYACAPVEVIRFGNTQNGMMLMMRSILLLNRYGHSPIVSKCLLFVLALVLFSLDSKTKMIPTSPN